MKTAINGRIGIKIYWNVIYSGKVEPVSEIFRIGALRVWKVVRPAFSPFSKEYYKADVLQRLMIYYDVRWEKTFDGKDMWYAVYSKIDGGYIGTPEMAYRYLQRGITRMMKAKPDVGICTIGFNPEEQKWYGWSYRAICGFGIGDVVERESLCASTGWTKEYIKKHPEEDTSLPVGFVATNLDDAKKMAIAFAEAVG